MNPGDLFRELTPKIGSPDEKEFLLWLRSNVEVFERDHYGFGDIALMARLVGFDCELVYRLLGPASLDGKFIENMAAFEVWKELEYAKDPDSSAMLLARREGYWRDKFIKPLWDDYLKHDRGLLDD